MEDSKARCNTSEVVKDVEKLLPELNGKLMGMASLVSTIEISVLDDYYFGEGNVF